MVIPTVDLFNRWLFLLSISSIEACELYLGTYVLYLFGWLVLSRRYAIYIHVLVYWICCYILFFDQIIKFSQLCLLRRTCIYMLILIIHRLLVASWTKFMCSE